MGKSFNIFIKLIKFGVWNLDFISFQELLSCVYCQVFNLITLDAREVRAEYFCCHSLAGSIYGEQRNAIDYDLRKYKCQKEVTFSPLLLLFHPFLSPGHCQTGHDLDLVVWEKCVARKEPLEPYQNNCCVRVKGQV